MKTVLMIALLTTAGLAQAEQVSEAPLSEQGQAGQLFQGMWGWSIPCAPGLKPIGNDCVPPAEWE